MDSRRVGWCNTAEAASTANNDLGIPYGSLLTAAAPVHVSTCSAFCTVCRPLTEPAVVTLDGHRPPARAMTASPPPQRLRGPRAPPSAGCPAPSALPRCGRGLGAGRNGPHPSGTAPHALPCTAVRASDAIQHPSDCSTVCQGAMTTMYAALLPPHPIPPLPPSVPLASIIVLRLPQTPP